MLRRPQPSMEPHAPQLTVGPAPRSISGLQLHRCESSWLYEGSGFDIGRRT